MTTRYEAWVGINLRGYITIEHTVEHPKEEEEIEEEIKDRIYQGSFNVEINYDFDRDEIDILELTPVNGEGEKHVNHSKQ